MMCTDSLLIIDKLDLLENVFCKVFISSVVTKIVQKVNTIVNYTDLHTNFIITQQLQKMFSNGQYYCKAGRSDG